MSSIDPSQLRIYIANEVAAVLSFFGALAIIINYLFYSNKNQILYKLIFSLSLSDFGGSIFIAVSQGLLFAPGSISYGRGLCVFLRAGINLFFLSSFIWTTCISLHIWICAHQRSQIPVYYFHIVAWGVPAIMTIILIAGQFIVVEPETHWCHPNSVGSWAFWVGPLLVAFMFNAIFYALSLTRYSRSFRARQSNAALESPLLQSQSLVKNKNSPETLLRKTVIRLTLYLGVFFLCWVWDVVAKSMETAGSSPPYWLELAKSVFSPLQGFLNFLVYGTTTRKFWRRPTTKQRQTRTRVAPSGLFQSYGLLDDGEVLRVN
eukprot:TRINITY_DN2155_c0_g1_i1.p1 TRINITY_DN2155_c0_g1~~TRINITY_DN2155_c0_g1_i1.p1  ORF type:complete len:319 (-),score=46.23 TRINITY_DN2155_c0_g1_i1:87-1043(-)